MFQEINEDINYTIKHWYLPVIAGILLLGLGCYTFASPVASYLTLAMLFALTFIFSGISDILFSLVNRSVVRNWGWTLALGIITFLFGIFLVRNPNLSMVSLPIYIGFIVMFRSSAAIGLSIDMKDISNSGWGWIMFSGIIGLIFSFLLIFDPLFGGMTVVFWTGIVLTTAGILSLIVGFKLKSLQPK